MSRSRVITVAWQQRKAFPSRHRRTSGDPAKLFWRFANLYWARNGFAENLNLLRKYRTVPVVLLYSYFLTMLQLLLRHDLAMDVIHLRGMTGFIV